MLKWYDRAGKNDDVVISTRIRLARNFSDYKFADGMSEEEACTMTKTVADKFDEEFPDAYRCIYMNECDETKRKAMKEQRIINSTMVKRSSGAVLLSPDEGTSIMLNSDDHVRIQVLANGMNMPVCFKKANDIDDYIDSQFDYAFDERYGYKTTFPTNVGSGMRACYSLHLPGLANARKISGISAELGRFGIKIRPVYGNDENSYGNFYQISNQKTLGQSETEIIKDLDDIVMQIIEQEREQRQYQYENDRYRTEDVAFKSYGVLKYARKMGLKDAVTLLSEYMSGVALGILSVDPKNYHGINRILSDIQPAVLINTSKKALSPDEVEVLRAEYIRNNLPELN